MASKMAAKLENPNLFGIYEIGNVNQIYTSFCVLSNTERIISSRKCIFDDIFSKLWLFSNNFGSLGSNFKTTSG